MKNKRNIFYLIILLLTLIILVIGVTLSYFTMSKSAKTDSTIINAGAIDINYLDGVYIDNPILWPVSEPLFSDYSDNIYRNNFVISSHSTLEQTIDITLNITTNEFLDNNIGFSLYNSSGVKISSGYINGTGAIKLLSGYSLGLDEVQNYTLLVWLYNKNYSQNDVQNKGIQGYISVFAEQKKY